MMAMQFRFTRGSGRARCKLCQEMIKNGDPCIQAVSSCGYSGSNAEGYIHWRHTWSNEFGKWEK